MGDNAQKEHCLLFLFIIYHKCKKKSVEKKWRNYKQRLLSTR